MIDDAPTEMTIEKYVHKKPDNEHLVLVHYLNTISGERRVIEHDVSYPEYDGVFHSYIWAEGNYSCDCNRSLFFFNHEEEWDCNTDENKILIERIIDKNTGIELWEGDIKYQPFFQRSNQ